MNIFQIFSGLISGLWVVLALACAPAGYATAHPAPAVPDTTATSVVALPATARGNPGQQVLVPVVLIASNELDSCKAITFTIKISFNRSMLAPPVGTPSVIRGNRVEITVNGRRTPGSDTLILLRFTGALGDSDITTMVIELFQWTGNTCPVRVATSNGMYISLKVCREQGNRFLTVGGNTLALHLPDLPDPLQTMIHVGFSTPEAGQTRIWVCDATGRRVQTLLDAPVTQPGQYTVPFDTGLLPTGLYLCAMQTPTGFVRKKFIVRR